MRQTNSEASVATPRLDHEFFDNEVRPHLGVVLLRSRMLRPEQLDAALAEQRERNMRLGEILIERGWLFPQDLARALAIQEGIDYVDIQYSSVDRAAAKLLDSEIGLRHCAIPVRLRPDGSLLVAVGDPTSAGLAEIVAALNCRLVFAVSDPGDVMTAWRTLLGGGRW
jgi:MshEN domain